LIVGIVARAGHRRGRPTTPTSSLPGSAAQEQRPVRQN
jgi:hypothetical protein